MGDVVRYTEGGREFTVYGLEAKADSISAAARGVDDVIDRWKSAGDRALAEWRGTHAVTMVDLHHVALDQVASLHQTLSLTAIRCRMFPAPFTPSGTVGAGFQAGRAAAALDAPPADGSVSAVTADLRSYAVTMTGSSALFPVRSATVDYDGLRAEVTESRPLTPQERDRRLAQGATEESLADAVVTTTAPYPVPELITLVAPDGTATEARARAGEVAEFTRAVADAIDAADQTRLDLLAEHPEVAAFFVPGGQPDVLAGDTALAVIGAYFAALDVAADGGDPDGTVSLDDLEAAAADGSLPPELQAAARYLLDNPTLRGLVDTGADDRGPAFADNDITREDLDGFLEAQRHVRAIDGWADELDTASEGGDGDGFVSRDDLEAATVDPSLPDDVRAAARYLLDNDAAFRSVADQEELGATGFGNEAGGFTTTDLIGRLVNGQSYVHDPAAAREFVTRLPVATSEGDGGIPITLSGDDSVRALAGAALFATGGDLTETQEVIAHLPESGGAVRNQLITAYYDMLAQRVDGVTTEAWGIPAGDPSAPGSGGANWLVYAPWASAGVRSAIDGSFSAFGMGPSMGQRQAAADGNQWIFNDITARFAAFVELYESSGGQPSTDQVQRFFDTSFGEGDAEIRAGFEAYVAAMGTDDPTQRQILMFQGNTLVATHEQAGAQVYLERVTDIPGPFNSIASEFIDLRVGVHELEVNRDIDIDPHPSNLLSDESILALDPRGAGPGAPEGVVLDGIGGWGDREDDPFVTSTNSWWETHGTSPELVTVDPMTGYPIFVDEAVDPDATLDGTGAEDWATYDDRMWFIHRMFEQTQTDRSLYETDWIYGDDDGGPGIDPTFLPDDVEAWVTRP